MELHRDDPPEHLAADIAELLAEDPRVNELGLQVSVDDASVTVGGTVATEERRDAITLVVAEHLPDRTVDNRVEVASMDNPAHPEVLS